MKNITWLVSYPKSGNTWFRMFLANYLSNKQEPVLLENIKSTPIASNPIDFEEIIGLDPFELTRDEVDTYRPDMYRVQSEEARKGEDILYKKVHDAYSLNSFGEPIFPTDVSKCAVYFVRNPLDVCISLANHNAEAFEKVGKFLLNEKACLAGMKTGQLHQNLFSWKSHIQSWRSQKQIPTIFIRYEDLIMDPGKFFGAIVHFLNLEYDMDRLERAIINSDFKKLQEMEQRDGFRERPQQCSNFFWKGKIGNYREYLSASQIEQIVNYNRETMIEFGYLDHSGNLTV